jgi:hypothetical protein
VPMYTIMVQRHEPQSGDSDDESCRTVQTEIDMTKGERWKSFFEHKGWIKNDVISGGEGEKLNISICPCRSAPDSMEAMIDSALILKDFDLLCHETRTGTVYFQWDDIVQVKVEIEAKKRGWL